MYRTLALILVALVVRAAGLETLSTPRDSFTTTTLEQPQLNSSFCDGCESEEEPNWSSAEILLDLLGFTGTDGVAFTAALVMFSMRPMVRLLCGMKVSQRAH
ncbi:unnamed protein product [Effrenium voratum]|nr:unnamed protein product [Effrenium voratum]|mmetsp:Transcript_26780/g.63772  ORF Transcript_26780/g.63772 Transcript_26780/m.63772 type:complete len:102 (+) Transcript_26780:79-384(+)